MNRKEKQNKTKARGKPKFDKPIDKLQNLKKKNKTKFKWKNEIELLLTHTKKEDIA